MRQRAKVDNNQRDIVQTLRHSGCSVQLLHQLGGGVPDLLVGYGGINYLLEVKNQFKPPSERRLSNQQRTWHNQWQGQVAVVATPEEALAAVGL